MPQVFKIGKRERTVCTVLFLHAPGLYLIFGEHGSFILQVKSSQLFHTLECLKYDNNPNYIHCNVCSW